MQIFCNSAAKLQKTSETDVSLAKKYVSNLDFVIFVRQPADIRYMTYHMNFGIGGQAWRDLGCRIARR